MSISLQSKNEKLNDLMKYFNVKQCYVKLLKIKQIEPIAKKFFNKKKQKQCSICQKSFSYQTNIRDRPYMTSDGRGGSAKSDFIGEGALIKHLIRRGGQKRQKSSDFIYGRPLI